MAKDPAERFQSGREVVAALSEGPTALRDARRLGTAGQKRSGRRQVYVWATVAMLMSVVAVLAFAVASGWTGSGEDHGDRSDASVDPGSKGGGSSVADPGLPRLAGAPSRPECARAYALVDQVGVSLGKDELFAAVEQLRKGSGGFADDADCVESGVYQSQLLVAGAHVVKEMQDVERLESVLNQAMQKADSDLEQLQRLAQLARLSGDGIGAAEAAVAIENSQASIANMRERAERVEQRRARLNAAGRTLAALIDAHGAWARLEPERAYQTVASHVGMQDLQRQLTIFLASSQDAWRDGE